MENYVLRLFFTWTSFLKKNQAKNDGPNAISERSENLLSTASNTLPDNNDLTVTDYELSNCKCKICLIYPRPSIGLTTFLKLKLLHFYQNHHLSFDFVPKPKRQIVSAVKNRCGNLGIIHILSHCTTVLVLIIRLLIIIYIHDEFLIVITTSHPDIFGGLSIGSVLAVCSVVLNTIKIKNL